MYKWKLKIAAFFLLASSTPFYAQNISDCKKELLAIEEKMSFRNIDDKDKVHHLDYKVVNTDWDDQSITSNVKVYINGDYMHFFSEQATIYRDETEAFLVLPSQNLVVLSSTNKQLNNQKYGEGFLQLRGDFFDSCEVISCTSFPQEPTKKQLELKVKDDFNGAVKITKIVYVYDVKNEKILTVTTFYNNKYKIQKAEMIINEVSLGDKYKFSKARKYIVDRHGKLNIKYRGYKLVDNRKEK